MAMEIHLCKRLKRKMEHIEFLQLGPCAKPLMKEISGMRLDLSLIVIFSIGLNAAAPDQSASSG